MKKLLLAMGACLFATAFLAGELFAYNYSYSPSYVRTLSRAATIGSVDAVYYNPVGLVDLKDGLYLDLGNQGGYKVYSHRVATEFRTYADKTPTYMIPNIAGVWKKEKAALALSLCVPAGGGSVNYSAPVGGMSLLTYALSPSTWGMFNRDPATGLARTVPTVGTFGLSSVKGNSFWMLGTFAASYKFLDQVSVTAGVKMARYTGWDSAGIAGIGTMQKNEYVAMGFSGFAGFMLQPAKEFTLTAMYQTQTLARGTKKNVKMHYNTAYQKSLDDYIMIGINLRPTEKLSIQASYQLTFWGERKYGTSNLLAKSLELAFFDPIAMTGSGTTTIPVTLGANTFAVPINYAGGNTYNWKEVHGHMVGLGFEYAINEILTPSFGVTFTNQDKRPRAQSPVDPNLAKIGVGIGGKIQAHELVSIELGVARYFYLTDRIALNLIKLNKEVWSGGIGITVKAM